MEPKSIVRMFQLCAKILAIQYEIPEAPPGVPAELVAASLQSAVRLHADLLNELRDLLVQAAAE